MVLKKNQDKILKFLTITYFYMDDSTQNISAWLSYRESDTLIIRSHPERKAMSKLL